MANENPTTGAGNIKKFSITSNKGGNNADLTGGVVEYRYYESVMSNYITSTVTVIETGNDANGPAKSTIDGLPIRGGEEADIEVVDAQDNAIQLQTKLHVNRVRDASPDTKQDLYHIDFVSKNQLLNQNTRVIKRYEGKISDNVQQILSDEMGSESNIEIDNTSLEYNFNGNTRKPFYICTWLASKSVPEGSGSSGGSSTGGTGGFLFYETREGLFFKSIDKLFEQSSTKKFIYNSTGQPVSGYDANIVAYKIAKDIDFKKNLDIGAYNNVSFYFDLVAMDYKVKQFSIEDQEGDAKTAGSDYIVVNEEFIEKPSRVYYAIKDIGFNPKGTGDQQLDNWKNDPKESNFKYEESMVQTVMRYNQLLTVQAQITIPGDFSIKAGDIIECEFPQLEGVKNKETNKQSGGKYMVGFVCHRVTPRETFTSIGLIRDSFGKEGGF